MNKYRCLVCIHVQSIIIAFYQPSVWHLPEEACLGVAVISLPVPSLCHNVLYDDAAEIQLSFDATVF